jgi:hypothetical protein
VAVKVDVCCCLHHLLADFCAAHKHHLCFFKGGEAVVSCVCGARYVEKDGSVKGGGKHSVKGVSLSAAACITFKEKFLPTSVLPTKTTCVCVCGGGGMGAVHKTGSVSV